MRPVSVVKTGLAAILIVTAIGVAAGLIIQSLPRLIEALLARINPPPESV